MRHIICIACRPRPRNGPPAAGSGAAPREGVGAARGLRYRGFMIQDGRAEGGGRRRVRRWLLGALAALAGTCGLAGAVVACTYGMYGRPCSIDSDCTRGYGAQWYCQHPDGGVTTGECQVRDGG